jgi:hypothetical protein
MSDARSGDITKFVVDFEECWFYSVESRLSVTKQFTHVTTRPSL